MKRVPFLILLSSFFIGILLAQESLTNEQIHAGMQAINRERAQANLPFVGWNHILANLARNNNWNMIQYEFSHEAMPQEELDAILSWAEHYGYRIETVFENIAMVPVPRVETYTEKPYDQVVEIFRISRDHYNSILRKDVNIAGFYITREGTTDYLTLYLGRIE